MPQSLHVLGAHIVFSTKDRRPYLTPEIRPKLWAYMQGILYNLECRSITVGGVEDHVHIFCHLSKKHPTMKILETVKKESSKWIKQQAPDFALFHWQDGYALMGVSASHFDAVKEYIQNQEEHHRKVSFQEELRRLLKKNQIDYDERYLWD